MQFAVFAKQKIGQCPIAKLPSDAEGVGFHPLAFEERPYVKVLV